MAGRRREGRARWSSTLRADRWVVPYLGRYGKVMLAALALGVAGSAFAMGLMFTSGYLVSASALVASIIVLHVPLACVQLFGVGKPLLGYGERLASHDWVLRMTSSLRTRLFGAYRMLCRQGTGRFDAVAREAMGFLGEDVAHIQNLYLRCVFPMVVAWGASLVALFAIGIVSVPFSLLMLVEILVTAVVVPLWSAAVNGARIERQRALRRERLELLADDASTAADWLLSGRRDDFLARQQALSGQERALERARNRFDYGRDIAQAALFALAVAAAALWGAAVFAPAGAFEASWMCAFAIGLMPLFDAIALLGPAAEEAGSHRDALLRLNRLAEPDGRCGGLRASGPSTPDPSCSLAVEFRDVTFGYGDASKRARGTAVMDGFSLAIPVGQKVAVLGRSGAGKSTLVSLAAGRLHPQAGEVRLFGRPASRPGETPASELVAFVQQDAYLFNLTLRENLLVGDAEAGDEALEAALRAVGLGELLAAMPRGLDTPLLEGGIRLSGGERTRVALARAYLRKSPLVLLDEPFAALDEHTQEAVTRTLLEAFADRTVVVVTHDERNLGRFDRVLVLEP